MTVMTIFGVVIILVGCYMIVAGAKMKQKNEIGTMILTEEEVKKCRDKDGFVAYMYWRELVVGAAVLILGVSEIVNDLSNKMGVLPYIGVAIGIVALLWFFYSLNRARELFLK